MLVHKRFTEFSGTLWTSLDWLWVILRWKRPISRPRPSPQAGTARSVAQPHHTKQDLTCPGFRVFDSAAWWFRAPEIRAILPDRARPGEVAAGSAPDRGRRPQPPSASRPDCARAPVGAVPCACRGRGHAVRPHDRRWRTRSAAGVQAGTWRIASVRRCRSPGAQRPHARRRRAAAAGPPLPRPGCAKRSLGRRESLPTPVDRARPLRRLAALANVGAWTGHGPGRRGAGLDGAVPGARQRPRQSLVLLLRHIASASSFHNVRRDPSDGAGHRRS